MERLLRRLMVLRPDNHNAYNALGYSLADRKLRLDEARTLIRKAVDLSPQDPFIADSLGWVEFRLGNAAEARRILESAYERRPDPEIGARYQMSLSWSGAGSASCHWPASRRACAAVPGTGAGIQPSRPSRSPGPAQAPASVTSSRHGPSTARGSAPSMARIRATAQARVVRRPAKTSS